MEEARTVAVNVFVVAEPFYMFNCRSFTRSMFSIGLFTNPWVIFGAITMIALQMIYTYVPFMNTVFQSAPISPESWLRVILVGASVHILVGVEKIVTNRMRAAK